MARALEVLDQTLRQIEQGQIGAVEAIDMLLTEELTLRQTRRVKMALMTARITTVKTLASFDLAFQPSLHRNRVLALAGLDFIERREAVHLLGPPGTGKSHLAVALGVEAIKAGRGVYFATLADIIMPLATAKRAGTLRERIRFLAAFALLIVDEIGYLPVVPGGRNLFFKLVDARYEGGAMILISNRGFAEWREVFGDPVVATALLDRLLHHAVVVQIEGASYRLRQHADLVPEPVRSKAMITPPPARASRPLADASRHRPHCGLTHESGDSCFGGSEDDAPGVDRLDRWAFLNGVEIDFSRPGQPTGNAYIEAFNSRFRAECLNGSWFLSMADARDRIEEWRTDYNRDRPHMALGGLTPSAFANQAIEARRLA